MTDDTNNHRPKRALVVLGAGASLDFGAPSAAELTNQLRHEVEKDPWMMSSGGLDAFRRIDHTLNAYLTRDRPDGKSSTNFEHIFHCAQELLAGTFPPTPGAANEFKPILYPFLGRWSALHEEKALMALVHFIPKVLSNKLSAISTRPAIPLAPLAEFISHLRRDHVTRIYTTNYDDFILQAAPDLYHGFQSECTEPKPFQPESFWTSTNKDGLFHLHGSIHLGFPSPPHPRPEDFNALHWFDKVADPQRRTTFHGSQETRMDGTQFIPTSVITGFDKLSRMQQMPLAHYYAALAYDAMAADIIYVVGSGLVDLHINARLAEARHRRPAPPLLFIDYWPGSFLCDTRWVNDHKTTEMFHRLNMLIIGNQNQHRAKVGPPGWTLAKSGSCAVWDKGFGQFLSILPSLNNEVLPQLAFTDPYSC